MKLLINFQTAIVAILCLLSCEKPEQDVARSVPRGEIKISAEVQNKIYTNDHNINLNASRTGQINGNGQLSFVWICNEFPVGQAPRINSATKSIATIDSMMPGIYNFQLTVKDNFGQQAVANYPMEVFQDTLTGAPIIVPAADQTVDYPVTGTVIDAQKSVYANPLNRRLEFEWSILQKPAGNSDPTFSNKTTVSTYLGDLAEGNYQVLLKVTNEKGLSAYDTIGINGPAPIFSTKVYESTWVFKKDPWDFDDYLEIKISDPGNYVDLKLQIIKITVFDMENQQLLDDAKYNFQIVEGELYITYDDDLRLDGKKARVTVSYYR